MRKALPLLGAGLAALLVAGCTSAAPAAQETERPDHQTASSLLQVTEPHPETGGTLLEGPTFSEDGDLYVVDVMAPPGEPKVLRIDIEDATAESVFTDDRSAFTSAQFSPADDRLYLTDILSGSIVSISASGEDPQTVFSGAVDGEQMLPDDIAFDADGNMFVSDTRGMDGPGWVTPGRLVRIGVDGGATVLASDLPSPNGIVFDEDGSGLWVSQYNANRVDRFELNGTGTEVVAAYPAIHIDAGRARVDSTAVDADGNVYQAFHGRSEIEVYSSSGKHLTTIVAEDESLESATNIAIAPGTTDGYITVSGPNGGYIYTFTALAEGIRQSNGG
ncbi:SMP-30/gluconolactonase/LRE family protein [Microbacterium sp.]|uniref:SMP-30/gluconolactonase/LRE family protein n=1 Tax=Microbacterium sp. TaxID=51671 RepID=UPI0027329032|nr:SMP-30/gluconolactonase/LRE family protein [Microbacterium sp.]MDP3951674.1 SMP-30/gluconolactonase/LRE family protein [Microbacterium sp.]